MAAHACRRLFVYGTLRRGAPKDLREFFENEPKFLGRAMAPGRLYDLGEYPGMLEPGRDEDRVVGELFELEDVETSLACLDDYEHATLEHSPLFERRVGKVQLEDGAMVEGVEAWVYFYKGEVSDGQRVLSGDYLKP